MNRTFGAALLFGLAGAGLLWAYWFVSLTWSESADSPDSVYLRIAAVAFGIALVCAGAGFWVLRRR
jgi:hypothetical protein